ncbi:MAG TPA: PAS domain S-box protein [Syntrophorhabdaceae bacterium]|nr:PAS domain S-box protein [Syntrophorhabdaceae bacterium]
MRDLEQEKEKLRESERLFRLIADYTRDCEHWFGPDGKLKWVNPSILDLTGYSVDECMNMDGYPFPLIFEADREKVSQYFDAALKNMTRNDLEFRVRCKDGTVKWVAISFQPIYDDRGENLGHRSSVRDITDRKLIDEALQRSEMKFHTLYDATSDAVMLLDKSGFFDCNKAALEVFGCPDRETFCSMHPADLSFSPPVQPCGTDSMSLGKRYISEAYEKGMRNFEWVHRRFDTGETFPADVLLTAMELDGKHALQAVVRDITDRKRVEQALLESESRFRLLAENARDMIFRLSLNDGRFEYVSPSVYDITGYTPEECYNGTMQYNELLHPDFRGFFNGLLEKIFKGEAPPPFYEYKILHREKGERWLHERCVVVRDGNGAPVAVEGIATDVTDRKRVEEALLESEKRFRRLAENARDMIFRISLLDGRYEYVSPAAYEITGYTPEEHYNGTVDISKAIHPDFRGFFNEHWEKLQKGEAPPPFYEYKIIHRDGGERWFRQSNALIRDENGSPVALEGIVTDITEGKEAEEKLARSEARFRSYFELPLVGIAITSSEKGWLEINDRLCEMLGYSREELVRMTWLEVTHPDDRAADVRQFEQVLAGEIDSYTMDKRFIRKKGEVIWTSLSVRSMRKPDGAVDYVIALLQDITYRKRMEEELKMHRDHLGELVAQRTEQIRQEVGRRKEREEQYQAIVESIREWVWETNADFMHTFLSPRIKEVLGYEPEELIGKSPAAIMPPEEVERVTPLIREIVSRSDQFRSFGNVCYHKDGHLVHIEANGRPFFDENGTLLGYRGSCNDVTERKKAMDELKERELELLIKSKTLSEVNAALGVLLRQRVKDREDLENKLVSNIREMVLPYINKIQDSRPDPEHRTYLDIVTTNLNEIISPFLGRVKQLNFTPREIEVSTFIKEGRTTKEIAQLMGVATSAVDSHRDNIRKKLGLNKKKANLRSHLLSLK